MGKTDKPKPRLIPSYFVHRGIISEENTLEGFGKALEMGAPGIELDVYFYRDRLKVTHYKTLVSKACVPYFDDVLSFIYDKCKELKRDKPVINVDLKSRGAGRFMLKCLDGRWKAEDFLISSFMVLTDGFRMRYQELKSVREMNKDIPIGIIGYSNYYNIYDHFIRELGACALITKYSKDMYTKEFVDIIHKHKLLAIPWDITNDEDYEDAMSRGVDSVIKDLKEELVIADVSNR